MTHVSSVNSLTGNITGGDVLASVPTGTNKRIGVLTLNGATPVTVPNTLVTANSAIFLTEKTIAGTRGDRWVSGRSVGVNFSVTGTASDTSVLNWMIVEPV